MPDQSSLPPRDSRDLLAEIDRFRAESKETSQLVVNLNELLGEAKAENATLREALRWIESLDDLDARGSVDLDEIVERARAALKGQA